MHADLPRTRQLLAARLGEVPVMGALVAVGATIALVDASVRMAPQGASALLVLLLTALTVVPVAFSRAQPLAAAVLTAAASMFLVAYNQPLSWIAVVAAALTFYRVGRSRAFPVACATGAALAPVLLLAEPSRRAPSTMAVVVAALVALAVGSIVRASERNARLAAKAHLAEQSLLEQIALGERARIARELHDVVAHHISIVAVQADAARLLTPGLDAAAQQRLVAIGNTAREALTEMRRLLGVLRENTTGAPTREPQPGLRELDALVDESRALTGASVRLIVRGEVGPLDPGLELTAFRLVQEGLTNARRHAPGAAVDVELDYGVDALRVRVRDNGPGPAPTAGGEPHGLGLRGMSERAAMVGGELCVGPLARGGFAITAELPRADLS